jgi:L-iditol 2-dehydrogenase
MHGRNGDFALQAPLVLGHEAAGVVTSVGPGVRNLVPGQRVAIEAGIMCSNCDYCHQGRYNLCKGMRFCSSAKTFPHLDGTLQTRMNHPAHVLHPLVFSIVDFSHAYVDTFAIDCPTMSPLSRQH